MKTGRQVAHEIGIFDDPNSALAATCVRSYGEGIKEVAIREIAKLKITASPHETFARDEGWNDALEKAQDAIRAIELK